jgi:glycosyltransferase involved in cell wall biosynthesis
MTGAAGRLLVFAPGVRTGGGLVLLQAVLAADAGVPVVAFVDARALAALPRPPGLVLVPVGAGPLARLTAQAGLRRRATAADTVLCLHGQPPLAALPARVVVFQQNRLLLEHGALAGYPWPARLRMAVQRRVGALLKHRVAEWFVQTRSMALALRDWHGGQPRVTVLPFLADRHTDAPDPAPPGAPAWDFVYVSDGMPHKNHRVLVQAWRLLAEAGLRPSLALTLGGRDRALAESIAADAERHGLAIRNLGAMSHDEVQSLYRSAAALVFASSTESFGLPLVEAARAGLPILAAECDFVRDVCVPAQTFDPRSPRSIARAVARHLGAPDAPQPVAGASAFVRAVLRAGDAA